MAVTKIKPIKSTLSKALDYIENPDKTDGKMLVSSFGCSYETADIEFEYTLSQALQKGNNLAFHLIQSFELGEVDYQKAHEIGKQLADAVTKGQHEYVLTTHIDKGHMLMSTIVMQSSKSTQRFISPPCRSDLRTAKKPLRGFAGISWDGAIFPPNKSVTCWGSSTKPRRKLQKSFGAISTL